MTGKDNMTDWILEKNCRPGWPRWTCLTANVAGLCSTAIWFVVLLPQVWKNFRRRSVRGLSVLWATANFTASLINLFFVFLYIEVPLYAQISSVYSPVLEIILLAQFVVYGNYQRREKFVYAGGCVVLWTIILTVEIAFHFEDFVEYAAITLWSIETFPQVILNMKLQSTNGQATSSVVIAMVGKTTDFLATNGLVMPLQYVIMRYFSTSVAYVNGIQVAWYYGNDFSQDEAKPKASDKKMDKYSDSSENEDSQSGVVRCVRVVGLSLLSLGMVGCVIGFCLNLGSWYGLFAPVGIATVMISAKLYILKFSSQSFSLNSM